MSAAIGASRAAHTRDARRFEERAAVLCVPAVASLVIYIIDLFL
jgi:hypothetical protein